MQLSDNALDEIQDFMNLEMDKISEHLHYDMSQKCTTAYEVNAYVNDILGHLHMTSEKYYGVIDPDFFEFLTVMFECVSDGLFDDLKIPHEKRNAKDFTLATSYTYGEIKYKLVRFIAEELYNYFLKY